jgi:hypothetical protein
MRCHDERPTLHHERTDRQAGSLRSNDGAALSGHKPTAAGMRRAPATEWQRVTSRANTWQAESLPRANPQPDARPGRPTEWRRRPLPCSAYSNAPQRQEPAPICRKRTGQEKLTRRFATHRSQRDRYGTTPRKMNGSGFAAIASGPPSLFTARLNSRSFRTRRAARPSPSTDDARVDSLSDNMSSFNGLRNAPKGIQPGQRQPLSSICKIDRHDQLHNRYPARPWAAVPRPEL